jgi:hypothetical protein
VNKENLKKNRGVSGEKWNRLSTGKLPKRSSPLDDTTVAEHKNEELQRVTLSNRLDTARRKLRHNGALPRLIDEDFK